MCEEVYTFLVNQLLHRYFSRILPRFSEHLFFFTNISIFPFNCCRSVYYKLEIEPVIPALHQLKEALGQIGLVESMCYPLNYKSCYIDSAKPNLESIIDLFSAEYSVTGSNRKNKEVNLYKHFMDMLESCFYSGLC